jgi:hypothetical protein
MIRSCCCCSIGGRCYSGGGSRIHSFQDGTTSSSTRVDDADDTTVASSSSSAPSSWSSEVALTCNCVVPQRSDISRCPWMERRTMMMMQTNDTITRMHKSAFQSRKKIHTRRSPIAVPMDFRSFFLFFNAWQLLLVNKRISSRVTRFFFHSNFFD